MVKRKRKPDLPPTVTVTNQLGIVQDKKAAGALFNAILTSVQKSQRTRGTRKGGSR